MVLKPSTAQLPRRFSVLGPLMGGFGSQAFMGCDHENPDEPRPAVMVFLPDEVVEDTALFEAILQETEIAAHIDHLNVMSVIGLAQIDDGFARIVEYADAESLMAVSERLRVAGEPMPVGIAMTIATGACMGVHYAHELGSAEVGTPLIHGAVRPGTLLVSYRGHSKITGYGAAVLAEGLRAARGETQARSDPYTAPEQVLGGRDAATSQTDIYGLGAVMFEMLLGRPPPATDWPNFEREVEQMLAEDEERVPPPLREIVLKAMRRRAVERWGSPLEMRQALLSLELGSSEADLCSFMENLFGASFPSRVARKKLLDTIPTASPLPTLMLAPRPNQDMDSIPPRASHDDYWEEASSSLSTIPVQAAEAWAPPEPGADGSGGAPAGGFEIPVPTTGGGGTPHSTQAAATKPPQQAKAAAKKPAAPKPRRAPAQPPPAQPAPAQPAPAQPAPAPPPAYAQPAAYSSPYGQPEKVVYKTHPAVYALLALVGGAIAAGVFFFVNQKDPPPPPPGPVAVAPPPEPTPPPEPVAEEPTEEPADPGPDEPRVLDSGKLKDEPKKRAPTGPGKIAVTTSPEMTIYIDGKKVGRGTATVEVKAGKHVVKGVGSGIRKVKRISVRSGSTANVRLVAVKGGLIVDAPAGSTVFVDGKKKGTVPGLGVIELYEGRHKVLVTNGSARYRHTVPIRPGLDVTLTVNFVQR